MKKEEILNLIQSNKEGEYWDFKVSYTNNTVDLLHDIICLSNNLENREAYLIIGIADNGYVKGVKDDPNRRNQEELISFIRGKEFAGERYPHIELLTIIHCGKEIDVIIINPKGYAPYYLSKSYEDNNGKRRIINAGSIYTRTGDKNTNIDRTASPLDTELLWKIHFGLHPSPIEKLKNYLLVRDEWIKISESYFYNNSPEYIIIPNKIIEQEQNFRRLSSPFYAYLQTNSNSIYSYYECKYHNTVLFYSQCIALDSGQYLTPIPEFSAIRSNYTPYNTLYYRYFIKGSILYNLHLFMYNKNVIEQTIARDKFLDCILIFENEKEREGFEYYVKYNFYRIKQSIENYTKKIYSTNHLDKTENNDITFKIKTAIILKEELEKYRII
ncbi:ATP-binding protein [Staphylococcus debuckii]|uniref:ATP-binding protein n=1 Tax=Staphylococcus debuckii TaxID=2044912 RepID=A0ABU9EX14_9STAP